LNATANTSGTVTPIDNLPNPGTPAPDPNGRIDIQPQGEAQGQPGRYALRVAGGAAGAAVIVDFTDVTFTDSTC
jgi:hypothetical protein